MLCGRSGRTLDPAPASEQAVVRGGRIVVSTTDEAIVIVKEAMLRCPAIGRHGCAKCVGSYLSVNEVTLPAGLAFYEMRNRAVPKGKWNAIAT